MLRASAPVDSVVSGVNQAIPQVADVFGVDTSAADTVFVNAAICDEDSSGNTWCHSCSE